MHTLAYDKGAYLVGTGTVGTELWEVKKGYPSIRRNTHVGKTVGKKIKGPLKPLIY
jgi:hypothetical protein